MLKFTYEKRFRKISGIKPPAWSPLKEERTLRELMPGHTRREHRLYRVEKWEKDRGMGYRETDEVSLGLRCGSSGMDAHAYLNMTTLH